MEKYRTILEKHHLINARNTSFICNRCKEETFYLGKILEINDGEAVYGICSHCCVDEILTENFILESKEMQTNKINKKYIVSGIEQRDPTEDDKKKCNNIYRF